MKIALFCTLVGASIFGLALADFNNGWGSSFGGAFGSSFGHGLSSGYGRGFGGSKHGVGHGFGYGSSQVTYMPVLPAPGRAAGFGGGLLAFIGLLFIILFLFGNNNNFNNGNGNGNGESIIVVNGSVLSG